MSDDSVPVRDIRFEEIRPHELGKYAQKDSGRHDVDSMLHHSIEIFLIPTFTSITSR